MKKIIARALILSLVLQNVALFAPVVKCAARVEAANLVVTTNTNSSDLAPTARDVIYIFRGAQLTFNGNAACSLIVIGDTIGAAAPANQKYGMVMFNAGDTITFTGAATSTNSGIKCSPGSAGAESKGCAVTVNGTSASPVVFTNSAGALNTANKWTIQASYGACDIKYLYANYAWSFLFTNLSISTARQTATHSIKNVTMTASGAAGGLATVTNIALDTSCVIRDVSAADGGSALVAWSSLLSRFLRA